MKNIEYKIDWKAPSLEESELYKKFFKREMLFSLDAFRKAKRIDLVKTNKNNIIKENIISKIDNICFVVEQTKNKKSEILKLQINGDRYFLSSLLFYFDCDRCGEEKLIVGNPARDLKYFRSLLCESCYKQVYYKSSEYSQKYKKTMIDKYGYESTFSTPCINEKMRKTMMDRYGVPYSAMNEDLYQKSRESTYRKYNGLKLFGCSQKEVEFSKEMIDFLQKLGYNKFCYHENGNKKIRIGPKKYYVLDFFVEELNLAIEFFGDYFHGNPEIYDEDFLIVFKRLKRKDINHKDSIRISELLNFGIETFIVWENDWKKRRSEVFLNLERKINEINNRTLIS
jgi:hypothetical protein